VAEMDAVEVADGHRAGDAARLPAGAGGEQTRSGDVRQGRKKCRGSKRGWGYDGDPAETSCPKV
jgi:hypothetical protein